MMKATRKTFLYIACAISAAALVNLPAQAQSGTRYQYAGEERVLEEVLVTVSKREESVQDIASSVVPLTGNVVDDLNILSVADVANNIPNVVAKTPEKLSIRGIAAAGFQGSNAPQPVAQHENGLFIAETGVTFPYYDIASIEVLRGPSGTVFGRNATAGAIDVRWQKPEEQWSGALDYQWYQVEDVNDGQLIRGFVNAPLAGKKLLARAAFASDDRAATFDNLSAPDNNDPNARKREWYRLYLTSEPSSDVSLGLRYIYSKDNRDAQINTTPIEIRQSGLLESLGGSAISAEDVREVNSNIIGRNAVATRPELADQGGAKLHRVDGDITWSLNDFLGLGDSEIFLIAGYSDSSNDILSDTDGTELSLLDSFNAFEREQTTAELRFSSAGDQAVQWILGAFFSDFDMDVDVALNGTALNDGLAISLTGISPQSTDNEASAVFLNLEADLARFFDNAAGITLFGGVRQNWDETDFSGEQVLSTISAFPIGIPSASFSFVLDIGAGAFEGDESFSETTGEFGARWEVSDEAMLYAKYSRGYKAGKLQQIASGDVGKVEPELLDAYEIGLKSRWLENTLQFNAAAFYYDYTDLQITQLLDSLPLVENAADASIFGVEADLRYLPLDNLMLTASLGYLSTEFEDFCAQDPYAPSTVADPGCSEQKPQDLSGNDLPDAPEWSASFTGQYTVPLQDSGELLFTLRSTYRDSFYARPQNLNIDKVESHTLSDFRTQWTSASGHYQVELFVENIENEDDIFLTNVTLSSPGMMSLLDHVPGRRYGASLRYHFF